ncbi:MAG: hypothetical protein KKI09_14095 [Spirochaetes bacterium]|nr:hypothetical protein [Spirochaetota bacterium]
MNTYGYFDSDNAFIITEPRTPEPWLHYLLRPGQKGTETFASGVSYAGGGFDVRGTHENTFVDTKLHMNDADDKGRYLYIHDQNSGELWSNFWQPIRHPRQQYRAKLGFGYLEARASLDSVSVITTMFVPSCFDGWIQDITIRNESPEPRQLIIYPYLPLHMGDALTRLLAGDNDAMFGGVAWDEKLRSVVARRHHGIAVNDNPDQIQGFLGNVVLFHSTLNTGSNQVEYTSNDENFLGNRFCNLGYPGAIRQDRLCSTDTDHLRNACVAFRHAIQLESGQSLNFALVMAAGSTHDYYHNDAKELKKILRSVQKPEQRSAMLHGVQSWWKQHMHLLQVETPDVQINQAFPWLQYQCQTVYILNRMKSRYHTGYEYGWGFRDILQDLLYLLPYDDKAVREALSFVATQMFSNGRCFHNFFINQAGNDSIEASDDPLWFCSAVIRYIKESADFSFLEHQAAWADAKHDQQSASILEHCIAGLERVWQSRSERGLPWMKSCDWNDDLNEAAASADWQQGYESVMVAQQLYGCLLEFAGLLEAYKQNRAQASEYRGRAAELRMAILQYCLDKEGYYLRALAPSGRKLENLGSSGSSEGSIFLEPQIFALLSGLCATLPPSADGGIDTVLNAVQAKLDTEYGAMLCYPLFTKLSKQRQLPERSWNIEKEPPGMKENGGIFMHLNAWLVQAYCLAGRGRDAVELFQKTLPSRLAEDAERYRAEPFVYAEYLHGRGAAHHGRGGHTWLTGTAPTMHAAFTECILGLQADYTGLRFNPCISPDWKQFRVTRKFRGNTYIIFCVNPEGLQQGLLSVTVDGKSWPLQADGSCLLPSEDCGRQYNIQAVLGRS